MIEIAATFSRNERAEQEREEQALRLLKAQVATYPLSPPNKTYLDSIHVHLRELESEIDIHEGVHLLNDFRSIHQKRGI